MKKLYAVPGIHASGRPFEIKVLLDDSEIIELSHLGKIMMRFDCADEIIAILNYDELAIADMEKAGHIESGGILQ